MNTEALMCTIHPAAEDIIAFEAVHHLRQPAQRAGARLRRWGAPALGAAIVAGLPLLGLRGLGPLSAVALALGLVWALAWPTVERAWLARRLRRLGAGTAPAAALVLRWDGHSVSVQHPGHPEVRLDIASLGPAVVDGRRMYLYTGPDAALILPAGPGIALRAAVCAALQARAGGHPG